MSASSAVSGNDGRVDVIEPDAAAPRAGFLTAIDFVVALAVVAVAVYLRRRQLGPPSLWLDDTWPAIVTKVGWVHVPEVGLTAPGFAALLKAWVHFSGFSETNAQAIAFGFGIVGPALVWLMCVARGLGRPAATLATAIIVTSPADVVYSARVKQYTLDLVLVVALLWFAWRLLDGSTGKRRWIEFTVMAIVATAISSAIVPVVCGGFLAALLVARRTGRAALVAGARAFAVYAGFGAIWWVAMLRPRLSSALKNYWSAFYIQTDGPIGFLKSLFIETPARFAHGFVDLPRVLVCVVAVAAGVVVWRTRRDLAVLLLTPLLLAVVLALVQVAPLGTGRTDLYLYPVVALLVAAAASEVVRRARVQGLVAIVVVVAAMAATAKVPSSYPKENMKRAVKTLVANAAPSDTIMVYYAGRFAFALYVPYRISVYPTTAQSTGFDVRIHRPHVILLPNDNENRDRYPAAVKRLTASSKVVWFIGTHGHGDVPVIEQSLLDAGFDKHHRYYLGYAMFLSVWIRS